jgi:hypothetical protein
MKMPWHRRLLLALAAAGIGVAVGALTTAPTGCASDCGNNCPINTAVIETPYDFEPGVTGLAWNGPACPNGTIGCRGLTDSTLCNHISVTGDQPGYCDVLVEIVGRDPMVVHLEFGTPSEHGCCKGFPVVGDWHFTIPYDMDAGIYGGDGNTNAVHLLGDGSADSGPADAGTDDAGDDAGAAD